MATALNDENSAAANESFAGSPETSTLPPVPSHDVVPKHAPRLPPKLTHEDINVLQYFAALRPMGPVARGLGHVYTALTQVGNQTIIDYCRHTLNYTNKYIKSMFTNKEVKLLSAKWDPFQQDITLLYKLLQHVCNLSSVSSSVWITESHTIEYLLQRIKRQRNFLAHEATTMTDEELQSNMKDLETDLRAILAHAGERGNKDMTAAEQEMEQDIKGLLKAYPSFVTLTTYSRIMAEIKKETGGTLEQFKKDMKRPLFGRYNRFIIISSTCWGALTDVDLHVKDIFVYPDIQNEADECVPMEKLMAKHKSHWMQVSVIQGIPGVGKTCLCQFIVNSWLNGHKIPGLQDVDLLVLVQCAYVCSENLSEFLMTEIFQNNINIAREDILSMLKKLKVLLLVDGWDEGLPSAHSIVRQVLRELPESRVIITVRPEFAPEVAKDISPYISSPSHIWKKFTISGFNSVKREEYIDKISKIKNNFGDQKEKLSSHLQTYLKEFENCSSETIKIPLVIMTLVKLREECHLQKLQVITKEQVYRNIFHHITERLVERLKCLSGEMIHRDILRKKCHEWFLALGKEAWISLKAHRSILSEEGLANLERECQVLGLDKTNMLSSVLRRRQLQRGDDEVLWEFEHSVIQQFLAAKYLYKEAVKSDKLAVALDLNEEAIEQYGYLRYLMTLTFLAAILCQKGKVTVQLAVDFAYLLDVPGIRWQDIGQVIQECEGNSLITKFTRALLVNEIVSHISSNVIDTLVCTLQHTCLGTESPFYISLQRVSFEFGTLLHLLQGRDCTPILMIDDNTDLCELQQVLEREERIPPFKLSGVIRISLRSFGQAKALAFCIRSCINTEGGIVHLLCHDKDAVENIKVFLENLDQKNIYEVVVVLSLKPWCDMNLGFELQHIFYSYRWPGTLVFNAPSPFVPKLAEAAATIKFKSEVFLDKISYSIQVDDPYGNGIPEDIVVFHASFDKMENILHNCQSIRIQNPTSHCHVYITCSPEYHLPTPTMSDKLKFSKRPKSFKSIRSIFERGKNMSKEVLKKT